MEIVIATTNLHKIREFREMLKRIAPVEVLTLLNFPDYSPPPEEGGTFKANAQSKAQHAATALQKIVLADDSGLIVPALNGAPGVHSRRYAGEDATDAENRHKLLAAMRSLEDMERTAYFECSLVLSSPEKVIKAVTGTCEGRILTEERGRHGFGYDSLFVKSEYDKTFAEMDDTTKNRVSHRHKAFEKLIPALVHCQAQIDTLGLHESSRGSQVMT
ncbi:MAG: RdgB/HAM1 family non-canonical purine NTP pyrophosphatase [Parachlamydiaceae bacterium]